MAARTTQKKPTPALRKLFDGDPGIAKRREKLRRELHSLFAARRDDDLRWWHGVGRVVGEMFPQAARLHGSGAIELLASDLQPGRARQDKRLVGRLYFARDFAAKVGKTELERLISARNRAGKPLLVYHVRNLLVLASPRDRKELLARCLKENWTTIELRRAIQNRRGRKGHMAGRKPEKVGPLTPHMALRDIYLQARKWMAHHEAWFAEEDAALREVARQSHSQELADELKRARQAITEIRGAVKIAEGELRRLASECRESAGCR